MNTTVNSDALIPLSADYPFSGVSIKSSINRWKDGYTIYTHPLFVSNVDCSVNKNSILYLTSSMSLFDILEEIPLDTISLGDYITLQIDSKFVSNVNNELYLTPTSGYESYFKIVANDDNTYSLLHGTGLYVTVDNQNPFNLILDDKLPDEEAHHQRFKIDRVGTDITIMCSITNESGVGPDREDRYWGYTKNGPEIGKVRANGLVGNNLFKVSNFDVQIVLTGLTRDHTWVSYYNEFENSENNKNVEIDESKSISAIKINHLIDLPYDSTININSNTMSVNIANMKTIQTVNYEYRKKI